MHSVFFPRIFVTSALFSILFCCCFSCSGGHSTSPIVPSGPTVQVVETTADRAMLLQPQSAVTFGTGGSWPRYYGE